MKKKILITISEENYEKLLKQIPLLKVTSVPKVVVKILEEYFMKFHDQTDREVR